LVNANYKFVWADVGIQGSASDTQIFNHESLRNILQIGILGLHDSEVLLNDDKPIPYFIVGDDVFPSGLG